MANDDKFSVQLCEVQGFLCRFKSSVPLSGKASQTIPILPIREAL